MTEQQQKIHNEAVKLIDTFSKLDVSEVKKAAEFLKPITGIRKSTLIHNFVTLLDSKTELKNSLINIVDFEIALKKELGVKDKKQSRKI